VESLENVFWGRENDDKMPLFSGNILRLLFFFVLIFFSRNFIGDKNALQPFVKLYYWVIFDLEIMIG
jgi:hypothetical protein